jgi:hypothetical protein
VESRVLAGKISSQQSAFSPEPDFKYGGKKEMEATRNSKFSRRFRLWITGDSAF